MYITEKVLAKVALPANNYGIATGNGFTIDTKDFEEVVFVVNSGSNTGGGAVDIKVQHDDLADMSTATDLSGAVLPQILAANDNDVYLIRVLCKNVGRYMRVVATVTVAECDFGVVALLGSPSSIAPVSQNKNIVNVVGY